MKFSQPTPVSGYFEMIFRAARSVFSRSHTGDWLSVRPSTSERIRGETANVAATATVPTESTRARGYGGSGGPAAWRRDAEEASDPNAPGEGEKQRRAP